MTNKPASFAARLRRGDRLLGTLVTLHSGEVVELLAGCGFDWLFIDAEHGPFDPAAALPLLQAAKPCPCLIRIPAADPVGVKKALDIGAAGIIVPQVHDAGQAAMLVAAARYSPDGERGVGVGRAHGYGRDFETYLQNANRETAVVLQAESRAAVDNIDAIAATDGVDAIFIGPYDLSASLGHLGEVSHPEVREAIATIAAACDKTGTRLGIFGVTAEAVRPYMEQGFTLITAGVDTLLLNQAASATLAALQQ